MSDRFYVTSPIFYPNAEPHLGHAYTALLCDVLVRYHKTLGDETYFLTGTDENSEKIVQAAEKLGEDPAAYLENTVQRFKDLYALLDIAYDQFIRTSDREMHWPGAIEMWKRLHEAGDLYTSSYAGLYCVGHEAFLPEKELDENGLCPDHGTAPEQVTEENWFFKLSKYALEIEKFILSGALPITPETRKNEVLSFLHSGVEDVSFSRPAEKMTWGIPVPGDETQKMYVWIDALSNYISALGFGRGEELMRFWPGLHVLGKDILRFHAVFWPAMLLSAKLPLPKQLFVHGTIISDGRKMSKTLGNVISPYELVERYGKDATRYLLLRHVHPFEDTDITWERLDEWYTAGLVNGLGNFVSRVMKLAEQHISPIVISDKKESLAVRGALHLFNFSAAVGILEGVIAEEDEFIQRSEPFKKIKSEKVEEKKQGVADIERLVRQTAWVAQQLAAFMPETSEKILMAIRDNQKPENLFPRLN